MVVAGGARREGLLEPFQRLIETVLEPGQLAQSVQSHPCPPAADRSSGARENELADVPPVVVVPTNEEKPGEADAQCPTELV
jgi:hypothetical protein